MRKFLFAFALVLSATQAFTQCAPDTTLQLVGFYPPDSMLACVEDGEYYDEVIQFKNFSSIAGDAIGFPGFVFTVNWVRIDSVRNLPAGLSYNCNDPNCTYTTGEVGCVNITGTTNAPAGEYYLGFYATVELDLNGTPFTAQADSQLLAANGLSYKLTVIQAGDSCPNGQYVAPVCNPDPNLTQVGFYPPDTLLDCVESGTYYDEVIQFKNFDMIPGSVIGFPGFTFTILSVRLDSVRNAPAGITYQCSNPDCYFTGGEIGCVRMSGITYAPPGNYTLGFYATVEVDLGSGAPLIVNADSAFLANAGLGYSLTVIAAGTPCPNTFAAGPLSVNAGSPPVVCAGDTIPLSASINGGAGPYSFIWSPGSNLSNPVLPNPLLYPENPGTYSVTVTDNNGSTATDDVTISYVSGPIVTVSDDATICPGGSAQLSASGGSGYSWQPATGLSATNIFNPIATPAATTVYSVIVSNGGCSNSGSVTVAVDTTLPEADFSFIKNNFNVAFLNSTSNGATYFWDFGDGNTSTDENPNHQYLQQLAYTVTLVATGACGQKDTSSSLVDMSVGIADVYENILNIYPNPNSGDFFVGFLNRQAQPVGLSVSNLQGEVVYQELTGEKSIVISKKVSLPRLSPGIYFLSVTAGGQKFYKKLIIQP